MPHTIRGNAPIIQPEELSSKDFADLGNLEIVYPVSLPGTGVILKTSWIIIGNFNFTFTIASLAELSSHPNPVLNFPSQSQFINKVLEKLLPVRLIFAIP
ncbi:hypothetical protein TNCV_2579281 [Trichonephila clavipes]|uniref:Uncharacterized protein n=1 Tax=Trichonephila clavipes TaxID=2585209 RepID=A0A8X6SGB3_TRICX|nr:hypothetical protein TNCV_2579281 [Trichonephila clavipes]